MSRLEFIDYRAVRWATWALLAVFVYGMGLFMIAQPSVRMEALQATPFVLTITTFVLMFFAETMYTFRMLVVFCTIATLGFLIELFGVQTGIVFGNYQYTANWGILFWDTPPLIGVNWLFLSYSWATVMQNTAFAPPSRIVYAAVGMLAYDVLLEQVAAPMQLWDWQGGLVPLRNYAAWFVMALLFQALLWRCRIVTANRMALPLLVLQIALFVGVLVLVGDRG